MNGTEDAARTRSAVRELAQRLILPGFTTRDDAHEAVAEFASGLDPVPDAAEVASIVDEIWWRRASEQCDWVDVGDSARFEAALYELDRAGLLVRENFSCCTACGMRDIHDEPHDGKRAFVFFHHEDCEGLAEQSPILSLSFGRFPTLADADTDPEQLASILTLIGAEIATMMQRFDLAVSWDGRGTSRVAVHLRNWRRSLPVR